ncbi:hypothetical protein ALPO108162_02015 [Alicyclobacillus pomorum]
MRHGWITQLGQTPIRLPSLCDKIHDYPIVLRFGESVNPAAVLPPIHI